METTAARKKLSVFGLISALKRRKLYFLIPILVLTAAAFFYSQRGAKRYQARVLVAIEPVVPAAFLSDRQYAPPSISVQDHLRQVKETLFADPLLERVIREFSLYDLDHGEAAQDLDTMKSRIQIQVDGQDSFFIIFEAPERQQAMQVANRLAGLLVERNSEQLGERVQQADTFLDAEVDRLRKQVDAEEHGLAVYKQSVSQALPERVVDNLKRVDGLRQGIQTKADQIAEAEARRSAISEEMKTLEKQGALEAEPKEKTSTEVALDESRNKLRQLRARYTGENPLVTQTEKEVKSLEAAVAGQTTGPQRGLSAVQMRYIALQAELKSIGERLKSYQKEQDSLSAALPGEEHKVDSSPGYETALSQRTRDAALTRSRYEALLAKQQEAKLDQRAGKSEAGVSFKIVDPAQLPTGPAGAKEYQLLLLGLAAGCGMGMAAVMFREHIDSTFASVEEFQEFTNLPVLAAIPRIQNRPLKTKTPANGMHSKAQVIPENAQNRGPALDVRRLNKARLTILSDPHSVPSEQYRILTLKVQQWMAKTGGKVLVVTSAAGGEGKSVTALNLSLALSSSLGGNVLLIDADLWRPRVSEYLGLTAAKGFSDALASSHPSFGSCVTRIDHLDVISGGTKLADPAGLLAARTFRTTIDQLREEYQLIVIDSPPLVPAADSHVLAGLADGVIIVVRAYQTERELLRRALESMDAQNLLGVVLNDVDFGNTRYAYAYRYYQKQRFG
jgi:polysaccharide biosynthesis transport protein